MEKENKKQISKNYKSRSNYKTGGCIKFTCIYFGTNICNDYCYGHSKFTEIEPLIPNIPSYFDSPEYKKIQKQIKKKLGFL